MPFPLRPWFALVALALSACAEKPLPEMSPAMAPFSAEMMAAEVRPHIGEEIAEGVRATNVSVSGSQVIVTAQFSEARRAELAEKVRDFNKDAAESFCPTYARFFRAGGSIRIDMIDSAGRLPYSVTISSCPGTA
jgi:hypothetical protein